MLKQMLLEKCIEIGLPPVRVVAKGIQDSSIKYYTVENIARKFNISVLGIIRTASNQIMINTLATTKERVFQTVLYNDEKGEYAFLIKSHKKLNIIM